MNRPGPRPLDRPSDWASAPTVAVIAGLGAAAGTADILASIIWPTWAAALVIVPCTLIAAFAILVTAAWMADRHTARTRTSGGR